MKTLTLTLSISVLGLIFGLSNCSSPPPKISEEVRAVSAARGLYIKTTTTQGLKDSTTREESISKVADDYFEVSLNSYSGGKYYQAARDVEKYDPVSGRLVWFDVTDSLGAPIQFQTTTNFLNHLSARDYEMVTQSEKKNHIDYTFKRKVRVQGH